MHDITYNFKFQFNDKKYNQHNPKVSHKAR